MATTTQITIIDTITDRDEDTEPYDAAETLRIWYPDATGEVVDAIYNLEAALLRGEPTSDLEAFLGIRIQRA